MEDKRRDDRKTRKRRAEKKRRWSVGLQLQEPETTGEGREKEQKRARSKLAHEAQRRVDEAEEEKRRRG